MLAIGEFNLGNTLHMELASYTFSSLVQYELDQAKLQCNTHYIRGTRNDTIPGRAGELFFLPECILQLTGRKDGNYLYIFWESQAHNN